jgi:hypothetical protein
MREIKHVTTRDSIAGVLLGDTAANAGYEVTLLVLKVTPKKNPTVRKLLFGTQYRSANA